VVYIPKSCAAGRPLSPRLTGVWPGRSSDRRFAGSRIACDCFPAQPLRHLQ